MSTTTPRGTEARRVLRRFHVGVMGTRSNRFPDFPYTAAMPFCTDHRGRIVVFVSHLSEHTRGMEQDGRVSFTASPMRPGLRPEARVTVLGTISHNDDPQIAARFFRFFPDNAPFLEIGGFHFYSIEPNHVRLIAGFGAAHWLSGASMLTASSPIANEEDGILAHMNEDHRESLIAYCRHKHGISTATAEMVGIDCDGFDVRTDETLVRFDFDSLVETAQDARKALVELSRSARR